jgi:DEAD/DEAH box helicase domain-containing protein
MSMELDLEKKLCRVEPVDVDYYTEATWEVRLTMTEGLEEEELHGARLALGYLDVNRQPKLYKKIRERTLENIGYGPITLDAFVYDTTGFSLLPPRSWREAVEEVDKQHLGAAMHGLAYILRRVAPSLCLGDVADIRTDVSLTEVEEGDWQSALYLYDAVEGGVGYAEKIFEGLAAAIERCRVVLDSCPCESGCPACVTALPPGVEDAELERFLAESDAARECTRSLLTALATGEVVLPEVTFHPLDGAAGPPAPPIDEEKVKLEARLGKASRVLARKRSRTH